MIPKKINQDNHALQWRRFASTSYAYSGSAG
jgi:hypothetical protein